MTRWCPIFQELRADGDPFLTNVPPPTAWRFHNRTPTALRAGCCHCRPVLARNHDREAPGFDGHGTMALSRHRRQRGREVPPSFREAIMPGFT